MRVGRLLENRGEKKMTFENETKYFPLIRNLSDVLPHIEGRDEFIVAEREHFDVVNYVVCKPDTFSGESDVGSQIRRECRGLIFNKDGSLLSRRFHKFFNVGEKEWTQPDLVDLSRPHIIMEKLDGSMVSPILMEDGIRWMTKMGFTDVAEQADLYTAERFEYRNICISFDKRGVSPIFEWCSRKNRVVIDHGSDCSLVLIGARYTVSGDYVDFDSLAKICDIFKVPLVKATFSLDASVDDLLSHVKGLEDTEGVVIQFLDTGEMLKIKTDWYSVLHKIKDRISSEHKLVQAYLANEVDDLLPLLDAEQKENVERFLKTLNLCHEDLIAKVHRGHLDKVGQTRAYFAKTNVNKPEVNKVWLGLMFKTWGKSAILCKPDVMDVLAKHSTKAAKWDNFKETMQWTDLNL